MNGMHPSIEISEVGFIVHMKSHVFMVLKFYLEKRKYGFGIAYELDAFFVYAWPSIEVS